MGLSALSEQKLAHPDRPQRASAAAKIET